MIDRNGLYAELIVCTQPLASRFVTYYNSQAGLCPHCRGDMPVDSVNNLIGLIEQYELLEPAQQEEMARVLAASYAEPRALAKELLLRDWLTPYQINQLFQGRGGELLQGDYVLQKRLGEGGMGRVFKARHRQHGFVAALKLIHPERSSNTEMVRRFYREISVAVRLDHPNIVRTVDLKEKNGTLFFAMEFLQGADLFKQVRQRGALHPAEACAYARQTALGLQHAHEHELVHRDIKPGNLFLTAPDRTVKILDFGLARLDDVDGGRSASTLTEVGHVMGTPDYLAPEQARNSHTADHRADLYSLGCVLYFMLVGQVPFPKGSMTEKLLQHQIDPPRPLMELRPDTPPAVVEIVEKLMAKDPAARYQTAAEAAEALQALPSMDTADDDVPFELFGAPQLEASVECKLASTVAEAYRPDPPAKTHNNSRLWLVALAAGLACMLLGCGGVGALLWLFFISWK
jgi:eukaryotic-like serine/threonine-protein kinase